MHGKSNHNISRKESLLNFRINLKTLREESVFYQIEELSKNEVLYKLKTKRNQIVEIYSAQMSEILASLKKSQEEMEEIPRKIINLRKIVKNFKSKDATMLESTLKAIDVLEESRNLNLKRYKDLSNKKNEFQSEFVEEDRTSRDDIEKLTNDLRQLKVLRGDNKMSIKSIFNSMIKGTYDVNYYDYSLIDVNLELDRLNIAYQGFRRKHWYRIDEANLNYVTIMASKQIEMHQLEFKGKVILQCIAKMKVRNRLGNVRKEDKNSLIDSIFMMDSPGHAVKSLPKISYNNNESQSRYVRESVRIINNFSNQTKENESEQSNAPEINSIASPKKCPKISRNNPHNLSIFGKSELNGINGFNNEIDTTIVFTKAVFDLSARKIDISGSKRSIKQKGSSNSKRNSFLGVKGQGGAQPESLFAKSKRNIPIYESIVQDVEISPGMKRPKRLGSFKSDSDKSIKNNFNSKIIDKDFLKVEKPGTNNMNSLRNIIKSLRNVPEPAKETDFKKIAMDIVLRTDIKQRNPNLIDSLVMYENKVYTMYDYEKLQKELMKLKKSYDEIKDDEIKRMIEMYKNLANKNAINLSENSDDEEFTKKKVVPKIEDIKIKFSKNTDDSNSGYDLNIDLEIMVRHFAMIFGMAYALKILSENFYEYKKKINK